MMRTPLTLSLFSVVAVASALLIMFRSPIAARLGQREGEAVPEAVPNNLSMLPPSTKPLFWMFVGDSLTEGVGFRVSYRRKPKNCCCSYRFALLALLRSHSNVPVIPVGPFSGTFGDDENPSPQCLLPGSPQTQSRHAAVWGVRLAELLEPYGASVNPRLNRLIKKEPLLKDQGNYLEAWMARYHPDAVSLLIGTNDLGQHTPAFVVLANLTTAVASILRESSTRRLALMTVLPFDIVPERWTNVLSFNKALLRMRLCFVEAACNACAVPVLASVANDEVQDAPMSLLQRMANIWCLFAPRLAVLHVGNSSLVSTRKPFMWDTLHPSVEGETKVASIIFEELIKEKFV